MALVFALSASTLFVLAVEFLMRGFDEEKQCQEPRDSFGRAIFATLMWMALLTPLFLSYH